MDLQLTSICIQLIPVLLHQFAAHLAAAGFQTGVDHKSLFAVHDNLRSVLLI
jgi:hypothetical protein